MLDNALVTAILIAVAPVLIVFALWKILKKKESKKELYFLLGFVFLSLFYIFTPDPFTVLGSNDLSTVLLFAALAGVSLFIAVWFLKVHKGDD